LAIVIDSDRASETDEINATKQRIISEFVSPAFAWVTAGREIENYIRHDVLQNAVKLAHPTIYNSSAAGSRFDHALHFYRKPEDGRRRAEKDVDKIKVAKFVSEQEPDLSVLDLAKQMDGLVKFIREAN